jgi:serine/threonine protein kinase
MADVFVGKKIGGYEIISEIGRGGMAAVFRAQQISMNRMVALKILPRQFLNDDTYLQRFHREVQIVSQLEHRNIVPVYDFGEQDDQPFIVMRYMAGGSADARLSHDGMPLEDILTIFDQVAPALDYAHSKQVLHRDLKPSNILLDESGGAYLTDFGIARILGEGGAGTITTQGVVGTPSYMSPEQAQGKPMDSRSDLYSLGVMLFELATGSRPFHAETPYGVAVAQVMEPPPPPRSINPGLSPAVENVILTAMSKNRDQRYPDAVSFVDALRKALAVVVDEDTQTNFPLLSLSESLDVTMPVQVTTPPPDVQPAPSQLFPIHVENSVSDYPLPPVYTPPPLTPAPAVYTGSSAQFPPVAPPRPRERLWMSAVIGAMIGCGLLVLLALIIVLIVNAITQTSGGGENAAPTAMSANTDAPLILANTNTPQASEATEASSLGERTATPLLIGGISPQGEIVYYAERDGNFDIYKFNLNTGEETRLTDDPAADVSPSVSPNGRWIVFASDRDGDFEIYAMDTDGNGVRPLTNNNVDDLMPTYSRGMQWVIFASDADGNGSYDLYRVIPDGNHTPERFFYSTQRLGEPRFAPDENAVYFTSGSPNDASTWELWRLDWDTQQAERLTRNSERDAAPAPMLNGTVVYETDGEGGGAIAILHEDGESEILYDSMGYDSAPAPSPDGLFILFTSDDSGRDEIYLMSSSGGDAQPITTFGGIGAVWIPPIQ